LERSHTGLRELFVAATDAFEGSLVQMELPTKSGERLFFVKKSFYF